MVEFWVFERLTAKSTQVYAETVDAKYGDAPRCPVCRGFIGSRSWIPPFRVRLRPGRDSARPGDVVTGAGFDAFLGSQRFVDAWHAAGLTGVKSWESVAILGYEGPSFYKASLNTPTAVADVSKMQVEYLHGPPSCPQCQRADLKGYSGIVVEEETCGDDDLFSLTNISQLLASENVHRLANDEELVGMTLTPARVFRPSFASSRS